MLNNTPFGNDDRRRTIDPRIDRRLLRVIQGSLTMHPLTSEILERLGWEYVDIDDLVARVVETEILVGHEVKFSRIGFLDDPTNNCPALYIAHGHEPFADHQILFNLSNPLQLTPRKREAQYEAFSRYMVSHAMGHHMLLVHPDCIQGTPPPIPESLKDWTPMIMAQGEEMKADIIAKSILGEDGFREGLTLWIEIFMETFDKMNKEKSPGIPHCPCPLIEFSTKPDTSG